MPRQSSFVDLLARIVDTCPEDCGGWDDDGSAFHIHDTAGFIKHLLTITGCQFGSFLRQLQLYGFTRRGAKDRMTFSHPCFIRGRHDLMPLIKRKKGRGAVKAGRVPSSGVIRKATVRDETRG
jgi:hypothetical protein